MLPVVRAPPAGLARRRSPRPRVRPARALRGVATRVVASAAARSCRQRRKRRRDRARRRPTVANSRRPPAAAVALQGRARRVRPLPKARHRSGRSVAWAARRRPPAAIASPHHRYPRGKVPIRARAVAAAPPDLRIWFRLTPVVVEALARKCPPEVEPPVAANRRKTPNPPKATKSPRRRRKPLRPRKRRRPNRCSGTGTGCRSRTHRCSVCVWAIAPGTDHPSAGRLAISA